jgi:hypothetical protein
LSLLRIVGEDSGTSSAILEGMIRTVTDPPIADVLAYESLWPSRESKG